MGTPVNGIGLAPHVSLPGIRAGLAATAEDGRLWHTRKDSVAYIDRTYPGRVRRQLADLSRLLETLLTSKLEKRP